MNAALIDGSTIAITDAYKQKEACAAMQGARWVPLLKAWAVDATPGNAASLAAMMPLPEELRALLPAPPVRAAIADTGRWRTLATPYEHQRQAVASTMAVLDAGRPGFALLMEMGTGKSLTALEVLTRLHLRGDCARVLIVAPSAVVPVWDRECATYLYDGYDLAVLLGDRKKRLARLAALSGPLQIAVVNYESAWRLAPELIAWDPDVLIADESQRIKGHSTKQTKGVTAIGHAARYRLALSGTPVTNGPLDVFAQWRMLDPSIFGDSFYAFQARYAVTEKRENHGTGGRYTQVVGYRNLPELTERAHSIAYRVTKAEALDLPETTDTVVPVTLGPEARRAYDDLARESVALFDEGEVSVTNVLTRLLRLQQVTSGSVPRDDGTIETLGTEKLDAVAEVVEDASGKVVVFCRFTAEVDALTVRLDGALRLDGSVPQEARGEVVRRFQEDDDVRVLVAQLQVGGAGITLHAASTMVFASLSFNYADYEQAKARIHRIGQKQPCTYVHVIAEGTVDETVLEALRMKRDVAALITDRGRGVFGK